MFENILSEFTFSLVIINKQMCLFESDTKLKSKIKFCVKYSGEFYKDLVNQHKL